MKKIRKFSALMPELVTDILLRLPVSSLLRFRCLSRSLCSEIDSEKFVKNHLNSSIQRKTHQKLVIYNLEFKHFKDFYFADFDDDLVDAFPHSNPLRGLSVYGSCNGLILLGSDLEVNYQSMNLAVWNPFTMRHNKLPLCPVQTLSEHRRFMSCGLGYDSAHDDYKVVMISKVHDSNRVFYQVWVFGLKLNFWRRSRDLVDEVNTKVGRFANGALYWVCKDKGVGFDLAKEVFFDIPLVFNWGSAVFPATFLLECLDSFDSLVVCGGNLYFRIWHHENVEFYLLVSDVSDKGGEDGGVSWRKEFTIVNVETVLPDVQVFPLWPLAYSKDGDSILLGGLNGVFWYNLENKTNQRVSIAGLPYVPWFRYNVCWESLVSVGNDSTFDGAAEEEI
ncbi:hypothetical protein SLE2022_134120 [Rubroshorea leprosula]